MTKIEYDLLDFQNDWKKIVDKGFNDYKSLDTNERIWFNIQCLTSAIGDGGLISFYYNSGATYIVDLEKLELNEALIQITRVNKLFPNIETIQNFDKRNEVINSWDDYESDEIDNILDDIEANIDTLVPFIEKKLIRFILDKKLSGSDQ
jgi:hypothetical protein